MSGVNTTPSPISPSPISLHRLSSLRVQVARKKYSTTALAPSPSPSPFLSPSPSSQFGKSVAQSTNALARCQLVININDVRPHLMRRPAMSTTEEKKNGDLFDFARLLVRRPRRSRLIALLRRRHPGLPVCALRCAYSQVKEVQFGRKRRLWSCSAARESEAVPSV